MNTQAIIANAEAPMTPREMLENYRDITYDAGNPMHVEARTRYTPETSEWFVGVVKRDFIASRRMRTQMRKATVVAVRVSSLDPEWVCILHPTLLCPTSVPAAHIVIVGPVV